MLLADLPGAVVVDVFVFVQAAAPLAFAVPGQHDVAAEAAPGLAVVFVDVDDGLEHGEVVEQAGFQAFGAHDGHAAGDALFALVDAVLAELPGAVVGEQVRGFGPFTLVEVVAEHGLQVFHGPEGGLAGEFEFLGVGPGFQFTQFVVGAHGGGQDRRRSHDGGLVVGVVVRRHVDLGKGFVADR